MALQIHEISEGSQPEDEIPLAAAVDYVFINGQFVFGTRQGREFVGLLHT